MDNDLLELEAELKRLRPITPSELLEARIDSALAANSRHGWSALWLAFPAAAAVALAAFVQMHPAEVASTATPVRTPASVAAAPRYRPVFADNLLYDARDEGLVTLSDGSLARRYRSSYVDTITWRDPRTQASLKWSVPRTEEHVIPVLFQ